MSRRSLTHIGSSRTQRSGLGTTRTGTIGSMPRRTRRPGLTRGPAVRKKTLTASEAGLKLQAHLLKGSGDFLDRYEEGRSPQVWNLLMGAHGLDHLLIGQAHGIVKAGAYEVELVRAV